MVPNGWKRVKLKELCDQIVDCVNKTAPVVNSVTPYKMLRTSNIRTGRINTSDVRYVSEDVYEQWSRRGKLAEGDIVLTREAPVGEVGFVEDSQGFFLGQRLVMYRPGPKISNRFLLYALMGGDCQRQLKDLSNGGTVHHLRVPDCGEIEILTPPIEEGERIAQILLTWEKAIRVVKQLIKNTKLSKKALMQQLLTGRRRLSKFDKNGCYKQSPVGLVPEDWDCEPLVRLTLMPIQNGIFNDPQKKGQGCKLVNVVDLFGAVPVDTTNLERLNASSSEVEKFGITHGDIFFTRSSLVSDGIAHCNIYSKEDSEPIVFDCHIIRARPDPEKVNPFFLFRYCTSAIARRYFVSHAKTTTMTTIDQKVIEKLPVLLPPTLEQSELAEALDVCDRMIQRQLAERDNLRRQKAALMQQLLTGKRRVRLEESTVCVR